MQNQRNPQKRPGYIGNGSANKLNRNLWGQSGLCEGGQLPLQIGWGGCLRGQSLS